MNPLVEIRGLNIRFTGERTVYAVNDLSLALACKPKILLADEPTTALDATVQIQILLLLRELQREFGMSVIFVTHDIGVAIEICDRVAVMYAGQIVEQGRLRQIVRSPIHPYP